MTAPREVKIFDTTLRDGEQSPGVSFDEVEKLQIARQLEKLGVDVIEAGFPAASNGDFRAVRNIARELEAPIVCALARVHKADIDAAWSAIRDAEQPRIHTFVSSSDIHIDHQMNSSRDDVKGLARAAVAHAKHYCPDVEFSPMDATRADPEFTAELCEIAIEEGATVINIPDTVGYATPDGYGNYIRELYCLTASLAEVEVSVHCHDDLGMAVANSLAGLRAGASQVECAVNGLGERAGNCSLEEVVMAMQTRADALELTSKINCREIAATSRLVSRLSGYQVPPNKAIVGTNAFSHESGIHQDGVLKERETYEIMDPTDIGIEGNRIVLGKHSGRHALKDALSKAGYDLKGSELNDVFKRFKELAESKQEVTRLDLEILVEERHQSQRQQMRVEWYEVHGSSSGAPRAEVIINDPDRQSKLYGKASGDGVVDAMFGAIDDAIGERDLKLVRYAVDSATENSDSLAQVTVVIEDTADGTKATGTANSADTVHASAEAYVRAFTRL